MLETKPGKAVSIIECDMQVIEIENRNWIKPLWLCLLPRIHSSQKGSFHWSWNNRGVNLLRSNILTERVNQIALIALIFHQVEFAPPVGYVEPERQEKSEEKKEEEVQYLLEE